MMHVFPIRKPSIGLSVTAQAVTSIELASSSWPGRRPRIRTFKRQDLATGLLHLSTDASNISEVTAFAEGLTTLIGPRRCAPVALSLPNQCAHVALLDFDV